METLDLISITSNSDTIEGRGYTIVHGYVNNLDLAKAIVADKRYSRFCGMGVQSKDDWKYMTSPTVIKIFDNVEDFFNNTTDERRKRALAKLDAGDLEVLGLTRPKL